MVKRRILFCGEASYLSTGFSTYTHEVMKRLYNTDKFLLAEMGSYVNDGDPRAIDVPWKFYPVQPSPDNKEALAAFHGKPTNQFGEWRFTDILLDFKPDIVWTHLDPWMCEFEGNHPFRKNYHFTWLNVVDGQPQRNKWLDQCRKTDSIFCYSQYGYNILKQNKINPLGILSPCADVDVFEPVENKEEHKSKMGFDPDCYIIGMVARNQKRKLFGDLIEMYASLLSKLKRSGKRDLAAKIYLYLHTTYPDSGFDIGRFVRDNKVGTRVLMTYFCNKCNTTFPTTFKGEITFCPNCNKYGAFPPHASTHCSREALASIYNLFDIYVQYSISEGFGMPVLEAKSCLPTGSYIESNLQWKTIESIERGDLVTTFDGTQQPVEDIIINDYKGELICITPYGQNHTTKLTPNHEVFVIRDKNLDIENGEWISADQLSLNDTVILPTVNVDFIHNHQYKIIDYLDKECFTLKNDRIYSIGKNQYGKEFLHPRCQTPLNIIELNKDLGLLLGYYIAEECADSRCARFTFHENEHEYHQDVLTLLKNIFGIHGVLRHDRKDRVTIVEVSCPAVAQFLSSLCGRGAKNKIIPNEIFGCNSEIKKSLIKGYFRGDGCATNNHKARVISAGTISKNLCLQLRLVLNMLDINIKTSYNTGLRAWFLKANDGDALSLFDICAFNIEFKSNKTQKKSAANKTLLKDNFIFMQIRSIEKEQYDGLVYNLQIANQPHYCTQSFLVHNCGVPVMAVDYSAMEDHANSPGGMPIRVERFFHECMIETEQKRALPDNEDCANKLITHIKKGKKHLQKIGKQGRDYIMEVMDDTNLPRGSWDRVTKLWETHFETCLIPDREKTWDFPEPKLIHPNNNIPNNLDNAEFVKWCCINFYRRPDLVNTYDIYELIKNLNCGFRQEGNGCPHCHRESRIRVGRQEIINHFTNLVNQHNQAETRRVQIVKPLETNCEIL